VERKNEKWEEGKREREVDKGKGKQEREDRGRGRVVREEGKW
jgi:hypothetical protein